jgi:hypothetical protein
MQLRLRACGINFVGQSGGALTVVHLYNAARKEGFCGHDWKDMANFVKLDTVEDIFGGSQPTRGKII